MQDNRALPSGFRQQEKGNPKASQEDKTESPRNLSRWVGQKEKGKTKAMFQFNKRLKGNMVHR